MRLRTQFTLGFAVVVLVGAGVTGALLIAYSYQMALHHLKDKQLLLARTRAQEINEEVVGEMGRLQYLATLSDLDLTDANLDPEEEHPPARPRPSRPSSPWRPPPSPRTATCSGASRATSTRAR